MKYLENLNTSQRAAVTAPLGPVSVLAGPGSGKTRVLTNRIQHLFYHHHFAPSRIRAVTFTQNGTQTMRERLDGDGIRDVRISTFHSLCRSIIDGHYQSVPGLVNLCKAAGVAMPFCWHSFQTKDKQPHLDWYKSDGRLTPDVALWIAFQYACSEGYKWMPMLEGIRDQLPLFIDLLYDQQLDNSLLEVAEEVKREIMELLANHIYFSPFRIYQE